MAIVCLAVIAVRQALGADLRPGGERWAALGRIGRWVESKRETIRSVEDSLLDFFHHSPGAFRESFVLQMAGQVAAVLEVYLILRLMGYACRLFLRPRHRRAHEAGQRDWHDQPGECRHL